MEGTYQPEKSQKKDLIPFYGMIQYMRRNSNLTDEVQARRLALIGYNFGIIIALTASSIPGLEKILN